MGNKDHAVVDDLPSMGRSKGRCCRSGAAPLETVVSLNGSGVSSVLDDFHKFLEDRGQLDEFKRMAKLANMQEGCSLLHG